MRFILKFRNADGSEIDVDLAVREARANAVIHGNDENLQACLCGVPLLHERRLMIGMRAQDRDSQVDKYAEPLSARLVGRIARRSLGAETKKVGRGFYLELTRARRRHIHQLARNMGSPRPT